MDADLIKILEKELEKENFDSRKKRGLLKTYLTAKYRFDVEEYILMGVSKGAPTLLFNKYKEEDPIFSKRISFRVFDLWFSTLKKEIESGKSNSDNYFKFVRNKNLTKLDKEIDVAMATTKKSRNNQPVVDNKDVSVSAPAPEKNFVAFAASSGTSAVTGSSYDPLALLSTDKPKLDSIWNKIPKPVLPLKFLEIQGLEEHRLFNNKFVYQDYAEIIKKGENKGILIDQKGYLFDPFTARPNSEFYKPEDHYNMTDPLPIPINMIKPMLIVEAITFEYLKPDTLNRPAPAAMHSMDLQKYLVTDYRTTILNNEPEKIFYKIENNP